MDKKHINNFDFLQQFSVEPNEQSWLTIEKQLPEKKKKRIIAWWWSMPIAATLIIAGIILKNDYTLVKPISKENQQQLSNTQKIINNELLRNNNTTDNKIVSTFAKQNTKQKVNNKLNEGFYNQIKSTKSVVALNAFLNTKTNNKENFILPEQSKSSIQTYTSTLFIPNIITQFKNIQLNRSIDKEIELKLIKSNNFKNKNETPKTQKLNCFNKKLKLFLTTNTGLNYFSRNNVFGESNNLNDVSAFNSSGAGSSPIVSPNTSTNILSLPKTGYTLGAGLQAQYSFNKNHSIVLGLQYQYLNNKLSITDSTFRLAGTSNSKVQQQYHILNIPLLYQYTINPKSDVKLNLLLGIKTQAILKTNALYINSNVNTYSENQDNLNKLLFSTQFGFGVTLKNSMQINLLAQKSLTPLQKNADQYYWQQLETQFCIPLK